MAAQTPFTDPSLIRGALYAAPERLRTRTSALRRAKIGGADATDTLVDLASDAEPGATTLLDVGCGRGTSTIRLAGRFPDATVIAVDQSAGLLSVAAHRLGAEGRAARLAVGDFHHLPIATAAADLVVAGFCLYHSPQPADALREIARCLRPRGVVVVATKSTDSYRAIDEAIASAGLDPDATSRVSLYETFHSANAEAVLSAAGLTVQRRVDQQHTFHFGDALHLAEYAATCPKYRLPRDLAQNPANLAADLTRWRPDIEVTTTSIVTYLVAARS